MTELSELASRDGYQGADAVLCTYCGATLGDLSDYEEHDDVQCDECEVSYELVWHDDGYPQMVSDLNE